METDPEVDSILDFFCDKCAYALLHDSRMPGAGATLEQAITSHAYRECDGELRRVGLSVKDWVTGKDGKDIFDLEAWRKAVVESQ
jgi:hypothetical protein